jgi:ABC-type multidrug transport system ATPase subunit
MQAVNICYKHSAHAPYFFRNLSFQLEEGKLHALSGKNGTGKTLLLQLLAAKVPHCAVVTGEVRGSERAQLVNQRFDEMIADQFSFRENLQFACMRPHPLLFGRLQAPRFVPDFLKRFGIDYNQTAKSLSGGQRQILALMMALQRSRSVLLLDEPTATLDEENAKLVFDFLLTLTEKAITFLIVCHDSELLNRYTTGRRLHLESNGEGIRHVSGGSL